MDTEVERDIAKLAILAQLHSSVLTVLMRETSALENLSEEQKGPLREIAALARDLAGTKKNDGVGRAIRTFIDTLEHRLR
jgi:hypothetical protein